VEHIGVINFHVGRKEQMLNSTSKKLTSSLNISTMKTNPFRHLYIWYFDKKRLPNDHVNFGGVLKNITPRIRVHDSLWPVEFKFLSTYLNKDE
jgi:hypothetical protein